MKIDCLYCVQYVTECTAHMYINILYNSSTGILRLCNLPEETAESPENGHLPRNLPEEPAESPENGHLPRNLPQEIAE